MLRCSKEAFARCPTAGLCGMREQSTFVEGSECHRFNMEIEMNGHVMTHADAIREICSTDEGIAKSLLGMDIILSDDGKEFAHLYCKENDDCVDDHGEILCDNKRREGCILSWLRQPVPRFGMKHESG